MKLMRLRKSAIVSLSGIIRTFVDSTGAWGRGCKTVRHEELEDGFMAKDSHRSERYYSLPSLQTHGNGTLLDAF